MLHLFLLPKYRCKVTSHPATSHSCCRAVPTKKDCPLKLWAKLKLPFLPKAAFARRGVMAMSKVPDVSSPLSPGFLLSALMLAICTLPKLKLNHRNVVYSIFTYGMQIYEDWVLGTFLSMNTVSKYVFVWASVFQSTVQLWTLNGTSPSSSSRLLSQRSLLMPPWRVNI